MQQQDDIQFSVSVALEVAEVFRSPTLYQFRFQLLDTILRAENNRLLAFTGTSQSVTITPNFLRYVTEPHSTTDDDLVYTLVDLPLYGNLWLAGGEQPMNSGSKWTQSMILSQKVQYRLARRTVSGLRDRFTFRVSAAPAGLSNSDLQRFDVEYSPGNEAGVPFKSITVGEVTVNEGESAVLQVIIILYNLVKVSKRSTQVKVLLISFPGC